MNTSVDQIIDAALGRTGTLISILEDLQARFRYLDASHLERVSERTGLSLSQVYGVATFYNAFTFRPSGRYVVRVCTGTACHVNGAQRIVEEISRYIGVGVGQTSTDGLLTLETVNCVGACAIGPVVLVNEDCHGHVTPAKGRGIVDVLRASPGISPSGLTAGDTDSGGSSARLESQPGKLRSRLEGVSDFDALAERLRDERTVDRPSISLCGGPGCRPRNGGAIAEAFREAICSLATPGSVEFRVTGCHGFCEEGPVVVVCPGDIFYRRVTAADAREIVAATMTGDVVARLLYVDSETGWPIVRENELPYYAGQSRLLLGDNRFIDPTSIEDYIRRGGYDAARRVLSGRTPEGVISEVRAAGLRGRGGAGFPTATKWDLCRQAKGRPKYVICNADEGDPGAYQDRSILEGDPHSVIEGMVIGAYAVGADRGIVYVRDEYPIAIEHLNLAIEQASAYGLLGPNVMGTGFDFHIEIVRGAGAFVCGEETALIASIEGRRGTPRSRPPFPVSSGFLDRPTLINNVKTWKAARLILDQGAAAFQRLGTTSCPGTMLFSVVGKVQNAGLIEVPMGITLRELIFDIGGGVPRGRTLKAVQTGGPSGGCLPASLVDLPIDYDALSRAGSIVGSGGIIVMDDQTCMVDVARYFVHFTRDESCGKCVPCQMGTSHLSGILDRVTAGGGKLEDLERLKTLSWTMQNGSLCGLGRTAPNPVLTTLRYFYDEYVSHVVERRCPALVCKELIDYWIDPALCVGCSLCRKICPTLAIAGEHKKTHTIDTSLCIRCGACLDVCPPRIAAISKISPRVIPASSADTLHR